MMTLLNPAMLWGLFALTIPIVIHFWYQKKGKTISWAAMPWLSEQTKLQARGFRLDEIGLLLLRCLLLGTLILLLSKPTFTFLASSSHMPVVHLVQPDPKLVNEFKFELQTALDRGEKVYRLDHTLKNATQLSDLSGPKELSTSLQWTITKFAQEENELNLYVWNDAALMNLPPIQVPRHFQLHAAVDSSSRLGNSYWALNDTDYMSVFSQGNGLSKLITYPHRDRAKYLNANARMVHQGPIRIVMDYEREAEKRTVKAALESIRDVFSVPLLITDEPDKLEEADWVFSDRKPTRIKSEVLYIISNQVQELNSPKNLNLFEKPFVMSESEWVRSGELPEHLMEKLLSHLQMNQFYTPLSDQQLKSLFVETTVERNTRMKRHAQILIFLFLILFMLERYLSLMKANRLRHE